MWTGSPKCSLKCLGDGLDRAAGAGGDRAAGRHADSARCGVADRPDPYRRTGTGCGDAGGGPALLATAKRPLILAGGLQLDRGWQRRSGRVRRASDIPLIAAFRYQDQFDNFSPAYAGEAGVGMPAHVRRLMTEADVSWR